jgi:phosphoribosylaminoimidazolecarboxamide formyltransferase / IMP cyclohydrolase
MSKPRRALLSVSDKTGLVPFAQSLAQLGFELISTGGTARALREAGLEVIAVSDITGFPEIMAGRVKTLHPAVHGALLARPGVDDDVLAAHGIRPIDLLVVNLYPFESTITRADATVAEAIENIDVGGPAMLRAAAKNHERLTVVVDSNDYAAVIDGFRSGCPDADMRRRLAAKAFGHTAGYDTAISNWLAAQCAHPPETFPDRLLLSLRREATLRYGENPHQRAALYAAPGSGGELVGARQHQGKALSYNNFADADAAFECARALPGPGCVIVKHANPCGAALGPTPELAYQAAYRTDPTSAFGGVIAFNTRLDEAGARAIVSRQLVDVIVAPAFDPDALAVLAGKPNARVLEIGDGRADSAVLQLKCIAGGLLVQERDAGTLADAELRTVTRRAPTAEEMRNLEFAWTIVKFVKSNAIVYAAGGATLGVGAGQMSRVMSAQIGAMKAQSEGLALKGCALASDAFFPFRDGIDAAAAHGVSAVIQPGGSLRDEEVIRAADEHGIAMVFTGMRHFRH